MAPHRHSPNTFPSAFPVFNSQDRLEKQNRNLTASSSTSVVAVGSALARCAWCSTGVLSARAACAAVASGLHSNQQVFCSTQAVPLRRVARAHCGQREMPISFSTTWICSFFFYFFIFLILSSPEQYKVITDLGRCCCQIPLPAEDCVMRPLFSCWLLVLQVMGTAQLN